MNKPVTTLAKILQNTEIAPSIYKMAIQAPNIVENAKPGQFMHIRCTSGLYPLLRRPMSIADINKKTGTVKIIYRVVGEGTELLSRKLPGSLIDVLGPLGKGFPLPEKETTPIITGGGIGVAPLIYLAKTIAENDASAIAILGFTTGTEIFGAEYFQSLGLKTFITTDDGSHGYAGFPTDILDKHIKENKNKSKHILYACGPKPMLSRVKAIAVREQIPAYLSLEEKMACGIGACIGCSIKSSGKGYKKVCKDGPVFEAGEIDLD